MGQIQQLLLGGPWQNINFALLAVLLGLVLGLALACGACSVHQGAKTLLRGGLKGLCRLLCTAYVEVFRATPMLVQIFIIYYGIGSIIKLTETSVNRMFWGMVAVGLNSAAYMSEIIRAGIGAVPPGQMEAARCLGMSHWRAMRRVVLPQAVKNILPAMCNEFVTIIKETSVLGMVGIVELMFQAQSISKQTWIPLEPYVIAAVLYFIVVFPLSKCIAAAERGMNRSVAGG